MKNKVLLSLVFFSLCATLSFSQSSSKDFFNYGVEAQNAKDWWRASEYFQESIRLNPNYADAHFALAKCSYELNDFSLALKYLETAEKYSLGKTDILNLRGMCLLSLGNFSEAQSVFEQVVQKYPNNVESRFGLAELDLFSGKISGAERLYKDALRLDNTNRKALLSLALVSSELGKKDLARNYISQAMQLHSNDSEVYYLSSYFEAREGNLREAERKARAAVQVDANYTDAYELLSSILYKQGNFQEVIDISDFLINQNRNNSKAWYIKGLAFQKMNNFEDAIKTWNSGLEINPEDEVMRSAFELLIDDVTELEDPRRVTWASYHIQKAKEYAKKFASEEMRYEYQKALKINPSNQEARKAFASMLSRDGYNELYLEQLKFLKNTMDENVKDVNLSDTIESYDSLLKGTLGEKWNVSPFYLDKTRWNIGLFYTETKEPLQHSELSRITSFTLSNLFRGVSSTAVNIQSSEVSGYGEAYRKAHSEKIDYFVLFTAGETERDVKIDATMYSARTGAVVTKFSIYHTGNNCYIASLLRFRRNILDVLPVRGKIISRTGKDILLDLGKTEGIIKDSVFNVVKKDSIRTADTGLGLSYTEKSVLGKVTVTNVSEEISEAVLSDTGFYDRVNTGDEVVLVSVPKSDNESDTQGETISDTTPSANERGETVQTPVKSALSGADLEINRKSTLLELIQNIY